MIHKIVSYLRFLFQGKTKYSIQSPFVHNFIERVLDDREVYYSYLGMDYLKSKLVKDKTILEVDDMGAGSHFSSKNNITVKQISKTVVSSDLKAQALFKLVNLYQPKSIVELGTSLGLTTCYLANGKRNSKLTTVEGSKSIYEIAIKNFKKMGLQKINAINASFDEVLPLLIKEEKNLGVVFFDGNHTEQATLDYFRVCKANASHETIFIFDDIYWSKSMTLAWEKIISDPSISLSLDLFSFGVVFFLKNRPKQHVQIIHPINLH
jgi:predicted O-methyltransferase YrrM